ncbi:hypothetical protein M5K25_011653 [Dendrobium thyrsiflorum]|uniref:PLAC8 motif-containing protein n=1 Tax=Dendrobium thyrsiflorum TaxID=117978 RepID=A0ABD0V4I1_DENTH
MESSAIGETKEAATVSTNVNREDIPTVTKLAWLKANPWKDWFHRFSFVTRIYPFNFFNRSRSQDTRRSSSHPDLITSTTNGSHRFHTPFIRKINWEAIIRYCKKWIKHPMNKALLVWFFFVAACLVVLFLFMVGLLNNAIPKSSVRKKWTEIFNQILNALFTIMCLYQHPRIFHHLVLLCCWRSKDILELRKIYCKNGTTKPHERAHMMFVVVLLHITCFSQYGLCTVFWAYSSDTRPAWPQILFIATGTVAPVIAGIYAFFGPLGRKTRAENDEEAVSQVAMTINSRDENSNELRQYSNRVVDTSPEWIGGLFDCWDYQAVASLSFFCTFCVFGWNMERLGFGNMYVHTFTFVFLCGATVIVFCVTALKIDDVVIRYMVGIIGIVLCMFGLLYGGFWRIQMRKKFKLPENHFCCGYPDFTDFMQWLFCWSCSLAQEVRTGNFYDVEDGRFYRKESEGENQQVLVPPPRENNGAGLMAMPSFGSAHIHPEVELDDDLEILKCGRGEIHEAEIDETMRPPLQPVI